VVGDDLAVLAPSEERFICEYAPEPGPVDSLSPVPTPAYMPEDGMGKNVGVDGREVGVGMELEVLVVALVLTLLRPSVEMERRDCGRRIPDAMVLCARALGARGIDDDGESEGDGMERKEEGPGGLDNRRRSFSLSLDGEGESSMISTHPEVSAAGVRLCSSSDSVLCRLGLRV